MRRLLLLLTLTAALLGATGCQTGSATAPPPMRYSEPPTR